MKNLCFVYPSLLILVCPGRCVIDYTCVLCNCFEKGDVKIKMEKTKDEKF